MKTYRLPRYDRTKGVLSEAVIAAMLAGATSENIDADTIGLTMDDKTAETFLKATKKLKLAATSDEVEVTDAIEAGE